MMIIFSSIILVILSMASIYYFHTGDEASVGIFSLAVTLIGTIFIAVELKNGQDVTCSEMLINLNNYFHDSDRLMKVYQVLEECEMKGDYSDEKWKDVSSVEVAQYCTFFENLYMLHRHHIANIEDLDDLFGYRFFLFMNNPYIQEHYLLPTSSSYVQLFELCQIWIRHRKSEIKDNTTWIRSIPCSQYMISEDFMSRKLYLHDRGYTGNRKELYRFEVKGEEFSIKTLTFDHMSDVLNLQDIIVENLQDKSLLFPLSRAELMESLQIDHVSGAYNQDSDLIAYCVLVANRPGERNLAVDFGVAPEESITFDIVAVDPQWRGYGLQQRFIDWSMEVANASGAKYIHATVNPDNNHSGQNFLKRGFAVKKTGTKYDGLTRNLLEFKVKS
jgi:GNAT superfamily N-acetyltransferase